MKPETKTRSIVCKGLTLPEKKKNAMLVGRENETR